MHGLRGISICEGFFDLLIAKAAALLVYHRVHPAPKFFEKGSELDPLQICFGYICPKRCKKILFVEKLDLFQTPDGVMDAALEDTEPPGLEKVGKTNNLSSYELSRNNRTP